MKKVANKNLQNAKRKKNDEFYTRYEDIEKEITHYKEYLKDKWVYSSCDDYRWSEFKNYFVSNFTEFGLKHYTCTCLDIGNGAYRYDYDGEKETITKLEGNGDFRSEECIELLKECDVVITNPPFSLFREYVAQLMEYGKKFLIIGSMNAITYKEIFPYIKNNELWLGCKGLGTDFFFNVPNDYKEELMATKTQGGGWRIIDGKVIGRVANACWYTNIGHARRNTELDLYKKYSADEYPKYDNYDAIEVSKVSEIPMDYDGVMGVPITFLDKYCPTQFEIVKFRKGDDDKDLSVNGKCPYFRILIRRR